MKKWSCTIEQYCKKEVYGNLRNQYGYPINKAIANAWLLTLKMNLREKTYFVRCVIKTV